MRRRFPLWGRWAASVGLGLLLVVGCGPKEKSPPPAKTQKEERIALAPDPKVKLVWPPPPEIPRVHYVTTFSTLDELGIERGLFQKLADWLFGRDVQILTRPYGVLKVKNKLYVTDPGGRLLHIFDLANKHYEPFAGRRREPFISPIGLASSVKGNIYVSDSARKKVFVFNERLRFVFELGGEGTLLRPSGLAIDPATGFLYVVDNHAHQVVVYNHKRRVFTFGRRGVNPGEFNYPTNIAISASGHIYITDSMNFRVQVFDRQGNFVTAFGEHGDGSGDFSWPKGIGVDSDENIYVIEALFDAVQIFNDEGNYLLSFGHRGVQPGEFWLPAGLFIDEQDMLYVVDSYNQRIQVFQYLRGPT